jgi:hypothetical protein
MSGRFRTTPPTPVQTGRCHGEVLLLSAFNTLHSTSPGMIDAVTLCVPVESDDERAALQELAQELAEERDLHADVIVHHDHLIVRLARRHPLA